MRKLLSTYLITAFCGWTAAFLIPLIIRDITNSAFYTAVAYAISFSPYLVIMPFIGVIADHVNKKYIIQLGELGNICLVMGFILLPFETGYLWAIWLLYFGLSAIVAIHYTTFQAVVPELVTKEEIGKFNSYAYAINNIIGLTAPLFIAFWLGIIGGSFKQLLGLIGVGYVICIILIQRVAYTPKKHKKFVTSSVFDQLKEGFDYLRDHPFFRYAIIYFFFTNFAEVFIHSNLISYLTQYHGISPSDVSYYYIPIGLGALIGSAIALSIIARVSPGKIILSGGIVSIGSLFLMLEYPTAWITTSAWGLHEASNSVIIISFFSLRQRIVPSKILSRVIVVSRTLSYMSAPLAAMISGWLLDYTQSFNSLIFISMGGHVVAMVLSSRALFSYKSPERVPVKSAKAKPVATS
ncbi:MAG: MFS transporter [Bacteroidota bacterium]